MPLATEGTQEMNNQMFLHTKNENKFSFCSLNRNFALSLHPENQDVVVCGADQVIRRIPAKQVIADNPIFQD